MAIVCSAVLVVLPAGVFITTMPSRVAAGRSILSTPTPARRMPWPRLIFRIALVSLVALRMMMPSASWSASHLLGRETRSHVDFDLGRLLENFQSGRRKAVGNQHAEHGTTRFEKGEGPRFTDDKDRPPRTKAA